MADSHKSFPKRQFMTKMTNKKKTNGDISSEILMTIVSFDLILTVNPMGNLPRNTDGRDR